MNSISSISGFVSILFAVIVTLPAYGGEAVEIPYAEIGSKASAEYKGDDMRMIATPSGARFHSPFQSLAGEITRAGLQLDSTNPQETGGLMLKSIGIGRIGDPQGKIRKLPLTGSVQVAESVASFVRPGLVEEFSVNADGLRQDFVVDTPPVGSGELVVELALAGAIAEPAADGATLVLEASGRELTYNRLLVMDAAGRRLNARMEVPSATRVLIRVDDVGASYPLRIDPTISDVDWLSLNSGIPGVNGIVRAVAPDGEGNIYVAGEFTFAGSVNVAQIAKWNGSQWSPVGSGLNGRVNALLVNGSDLYAGGQFTQAGSVTVNRIAKWNGTTWSGLGHGIDQAGASVNALAMIGSNLFVGGQFSSVSTVLNCNFIIKWDGTAWSRLGSGIGGTVSALAVMGTDLYAAGNFNNAGGSPAGYIAKWDGTAWSALGSGTDQSVLALATSGTDLYVGGNFQLAGGNPAVRIAKWDGSAWTALGSGMNSSVNALAVSGGNLYAGGYFNFAGGTNIGYGLAKWNGTTWSALGTGVETNKPVFALAVSGSDVIAGGEFGSASGSAASRIARWNGSAWGSLGTGMDNSVSAVAVSGSNIYVGGTFTSAGDGMANRIARWNGSTWSALGSGMNGTVRAIAVIGSDVYAGGNFTTAGGVSAAYVAKWNGSTWSALGSGVNSFVNAFAVIGTSLYVGGEFTTAGGSSAVRVARWNGSAWSALGSGMNNTVNALAASGTDLYAAGVFTSAGGVTNTSNIAKWDGTAWSALGTGLNSTANALAVRGAEVFVGGSFTAAGGVTAIRIARWDGAVWSALGSGMNNSVLALTTTATELYAGGSFTTAGGVTASYIARWNGSTWSSLGSGADNIVSCLTVDGSNRLTVGGSFVYVGATTSSPFIAQVNLSEAPDIVVSQTSVITDNVGTVDFGGQLLDGGNVTLTFSVSNIGDSALTGLSISKGGPHAAEFAVGAISSTSVAPGGPAATFSVAFTPTARGVRTAVLRIASNMTGATNPFEIAISGTGLAPDITVSQSAPLTDGTGSVVIGVPAGVASAPVVFTISNPGNHPLSGLAINKDGPDAASFSVSALSATTLAAGSGTVTFSVIFSPQSSGPKNASLQITSNVIGTKNPFDIALAGNGLTNTVDTDGDGMTDAAESQMATLGFDWQTPQPALVSTYYTNAAGAGLYTKSQTQAMNIDTPLLERDPITGQFTLDISLRKSTDLKNFSAFPFIAPQTTVLPDGKLRFQFSVPDNAAFFRLQSQ